MSAVRDRARQALAGADESFAQTGDVIEALGWIGFAAKIGEPVPPRIAAWLKKALDDYRSGAAKSMDAAMGLVSRGRPPRRQVLDRNKLQGALARMGVLHSIGATIEDAANLVARLTPDYTVTTLIDRYGRSGMGRAALQDRESCPLHWTEIDQMLAEYPDKPLAARQAKAAIRAGKVYARTRI